MKNTNNIKESKMNKLQLKIRKRDILIDAIIEGINKSKTYPKIYDKAVSIEIELNKYFRIALKKWNL